MQPSWVRPGNTHFAFLKYLEISGALEKESVVYEQTRSSPLLVSVNKVLLEPSHAHSPNTYGYSCATAVSVVVAEPVWPLKPTRVLSGPFQEKFADFCLRSNFAGFLYQHQSTATKCHRPRHPTQPLSWPPLGCGLPLSSQIPKLLHHLRNKQAGEMRPGSVIYWFISPFSKKVLGTFCSLRSFMISTELFIIIWTTFTVVPTGPF